jgi:hypothetical protein
VLDESSLSHDSARRKWLWVTRQHPIRLTLIQEPDFPSVSSNPIATQAVPQ